MNDAVDWRAHGLYLESLGISEDEKAVAVALAARGGPVDPVASVLVGATSGHAYSHLVGRLTDYPIPELPLPPGQGKLLLDIGCSWGRWSLAAARKGYRVVGIDPSLGAVMAARRIARQLGADIDYIVADARHLPFEAESFDAIYSFSVIQHFSKADAAQTFAQIGHVLKTPGFSTIQMAHKYGIRSLLTQLRRAFRQGAGFDVRYWTIAEIARVCGRTIGPSRIAPHSFIGLGLLASDRQHVQTPVKLAIDLSEWLRRRSEAWPFLAYGADSLYVTSEKRPLSVAAAR
jgi:SAM-dependent methyltransferase